MAQCTHLVKFDMYHLLTLASRVTPSFVRLQLIQLIAWRFGQLSTNAVIAPSETFNVVNIVRRNGSIVYIFQYHRLLKLTIVY